LSHRLKVNCAAWDLQEVQAWISEGRPEQAARVMKHMIAEHRYEPGVQELIPRLMARVGASPVGQPSSSPGATQTGDCGAPVANAGDDAQRIWTPDMERGGRRPAIWTPGSE
jgi:hypothetical protein